MISKSNSFKQFFLGDSKKWEQIYNDNKKLFIGLNLNMITPGQVQSIRMTSTKPSHQLGTTTGNIKNPPKIQNHLCQLASGLRPKQSSSSKNTNTNYLSLVQQASNKSQNLTGGRRPLISFKSFQ